MAKRPLADDALHEECGVFGVWAPGRDVARLTYFGLMSLQHRGQESAGIAVGDGGTVMVRKELGLVSQVFTDADLAALPGQLAIGHLELKVVARALQVRPPETYKRIGTHRHNLGTP